MLSANNKDISAITHLKKPYVIGVGSFNGLITIFKPYLADIDK
jgi:hypothetical protein